MSGGIRARRVVDPMPVQRAPYPHHDQSLTGINNAWNNMAEAKRVLQNAEARLEDAEFHRAPSMTPMSQDIHRYTIPDYSHGSDYGQQGSRIPVDMVPSLKIGNNKVSRHDRDNPRKKVTIVDVPTPRDKYQYAQSSHPPHRQPSTASTMNNYQPRPLTHHPDTQYNDPQLQRIENRMASRSGGIRPPVYEETLLRTQLREQERRAALLRNRSGPLDYQRPSSFSSPPRGEQMHASHPLSPSSHAILNNGPTSLSIDNSTDIRVLNDIPLPQAQDLHPASTHRHSAKHRTQNNYVSAYERLYGSQPGDKLYESQHSSQESMSNKRTNESMHMERLREKIEHQKSSLGNEPSSRMWHRDDDPVVVNGQKRPVNFEPPPNKVPVRKVASAPPAPAYKGFNEAETRFRLPDGSIISEDQTGRKTTRKRSSRRTRDRPQSEGARDRTLQPSRSQPQQRTDTRTSQSRGSSKPVRKVQKISETKKLKKPVRTGIISTTSWRDGQKAVLKVLGPAPKVQKPIPHSPPTRDNETSESVGQPASKDHHPKSEEEDEELSQHTIESEQEDENDENNRNESPVPNVDKLPSQAKDILEDLHLEESDNESEEDILKDNIKKEQRQEKTVKVSQKTKVGRNRKEPDSTLPSKRVRHYNANDVQKYMAKQRAERKKKMQDDKRQRQEAEERKKEQLEELFKKQKESAKHSQRVIKDDQQRFDETFSKDPASAPPDTHSTRQRPAHAKRLDVTSSDKENKGVWSTSSSSDSSLRSSPQTEGSHDMPLHIPIHGGESSHDPMEVVVTRITTDGGKVNGDQPNVPATILEEDALEAMDTTPAVAETRAALRPTVPPSTIQGAWTQPRPAPTSTSKPRSKAERLQALKATASALQGKIESEVRKLTTEPTKPNSPDSPAVDPTHQNDRWAYTAPIDGPMNGAPSIDKASRRVRFPSDGQEEEFGSTRYERLVGSDRDYRVFTGSLPGVGNLSEQASVSGPRNQESDAATKIQAAYRGHSVRQRLDWRLPSGSTLKDKIQGRVPQIHVSAVNEGLDSPQTSLYSSGGEAGDSEGETLSEGPISEEGSNVDYIPKFKHTVPGKISLRQRPQGSVTTAEGLNNARNIKAAGILGARNTALWDRSLNDGLSVINIYTKKYQEANKGQRVYHGKLPATASGSNGRSRSPTGYSYDEDFGQKAASSTTSQYQSSSATEGSSPVRELLARDSPSLGGPTKSISYENDFTGSARSPSFKYDGKASVPSGHHSKHASSRHGRRSPLGGASDNCQVKSDADKTLNSFKSDEFESSSSDEEPAPRKRPLRTPSPRLRKARTSSKSPLSTSHRSSPSSKSSSQSPTSDVRKSPPRERLSPSLAASSSRRSPHSRSKSPRSQSSSHSPPSHKSPVTKEMLSHFRPIPSSSDEGGLRERQQEGMGVERPQPRAATAQTVPPISNLGRNQPPAAHYSPGALELKMAAELNLLESLEVSVRQLTDLERTRAISLAQQESVSLARILQSRQKDHERELQLLSLKARQEVQDANKQLLEVKQRAAVTASEAERALVDVRKEATDSSNETAWRLMESQAEAARVTAEAARQLAEARAAAGQQPVPIPIFDAGKMATDTATAAASAAVTAAMEQQRQHQLEMLQEMRNTALQPPIATSTTRNFGDLSIGGSRSVSSHGDYTSSFTSPSKTTLRVPSAYSEDFTDTATQSRTRSPKSGSSSSLSSKSVATAIDESQESIPSKQLPASNSIKTASDLSINSIHSVKSDASVPTQSGVSEDRDAPPKSDHSSIQTESGADVLTSTESASVAEDIPDESIKSVDYSISFDGTESDVSKISDVSSDKSSVVSSVITRSKSKDADKKQSEHSEERRAKDDSFSKLSEEMLRQQLRDEEVRAQQQAALFKLREKALTEKTRAQLQLLEHEKRRLKEKGDEEGLQAIKRQQKLLLTKLQQEQVEIRRLKNAQRAASRERQLLLFQQQQVSRMRKEAQEVKGRIKDLPDVSLSSSVECLASEDEVSVDSFDGSSNLPAVLSDSNASLDRKEPSRPLSAAEKQAQVMQKLKRLQQPLNMKQLTKREQKLTRRRKNVEELLAWKQRLDDEEKLISNMEEEALEVVEGPNHKPSKTSKKDSRPKSAETESSLRSPPSELHSEAGRTTSSVSEAKSASEKHSKLSDFEGLGSVRDSESSIAEDLSQAGSIVEEMPSIKTPQKSSTSHTVTEPSSDDTLKNESPKNKYASESFESADRTLTPTKSSTPISAHTPRSAFPDSSMTPSLLSQRKRHESESGSESERSFSQTMSETASDQSDIEGRVRALKDALRKRKMEAERLRKQQKRMNREKLKAQEASLKKQLEAYDQLIEKTKAELKAESDHPTPSASSVKPKIKQPRVSESQRLRDQSHAKSLRQRAVSETSREGMPDVALRKQRSGSEGSISSRSSFDEEAGPARDVHTPASSVSTPPTTPRHTEDGFSPVHKTPSPLQRDRSISSSSSVRQPSDSYKTPSPLRSQQSFDEDKSRPQSAASSDIPEEVQSQSSASVTPDVSLKEIVAEKPSVKTAVVAQASVDEPTTKSEASDVPEDIVSVASSRSSDQEQVTHGSAQTKKDVAEDEQSRSMLSEKSTPMSEAGDDVSYSFSGSGKSLSRHSRHRSDKSDISYSDDFNESSVSIDVQNQEAKSETDDDISEHLSMASEPSEKSSGQSQEQLNLRNRTPEKEVVEDVPSVTVSVAEDLEEEKNEERKEEELDDKQTAEPHVEPTTSDVIAEMMIGDRVLVGGVKPGVLRFKGQTHFATGFWGGVELDEPHGSNNGTYGDRTYFECKPKHGIFAPPEKLSPLPADKKVAPESEDESSVAEEISVAEDINSEASVHTTSKSEISKVESPQQTPRSVYSEDFESEDVHEEKGIMEEEELLKPETSESSISRVSPMRSQSTADKNAEDTDEDSIAEEISDEAALEKLIHSTALAVESFSKGEEPEDEVEAETPRGPPETEVAVTSKEQLVDSITDHLTDMVVKDSMKAVSEVAGQIGQKLSSEDKPVEMKDNISTEKSSSEDNKSSGGLLEILAGDEALPEETTGEEQDTKSELPGVATEQVIVSEKVDNMTRMLLTEAISDMLKLKKLRSEKISAANKRSQSVEDDDYVELQSKDAPESTIEKEAPEEVEGKENLVTPPNQEPPEPRAETPFTPDDSPVHRPKSISPPLSDELFQSRVQVESSPDSDQGQVARPGSPVLGESSLLNPEALNERLEQLHSLDSDIGDLFGDQEWFDDDFHSMPKSKSIIQVPVRTGEEGKDKGESSGATSPAEARRFDLMKFAEEPFYAVPHNRNDVESLVDKSVQIFFDRVQSDEGDDEFTNISPPPSILGDDTKASDIESTSKKAYKKLVFDLSGEVYKEIVTEQKPTVQAPWMKPKRQPRRYFFDKPPKSRDEIGTAIQDRVLNVTSLDEKPKAESAMSKFGKKKKDHVDEILTRELREEEPEWVDYDEDELSVKMQLADAIFDSLLMDTAMVLSRIQDKRKARSRPIYDDDDLEF